MHAYTHTHTHTHTQLFSWLCILPLLMCSLQFRFFIDYCNTHCKKTMLVQQRVSTFCKISICECYKDDNLISSSINITDLESLILYRVYKTGKHKCRRRGGARSKWRITRKTNKNVHMDWKHELQRFGHILLIDIHECMLFLGMEKGWEKFIYNIILFIGSVISQLYKCSLLPMCQASHQNY